MKVSAPLSVSKDGGKVDAITAATITSRAFLDGVNRAWSVFKYVQDPEGCKASGNKSSDSVSSATVSTAESANSETKS